MRGARRAEGSRRLNRGARVEDAVASDAHGRDDAGGDRRTAEHVSEAEAPITWQRTATSDRASDRASFALAAASSRPPLAPLASDVDVRSNALDDDEGSSSQE